jgi:hypothetical protein
MIMEKLESINPGEAKCHQCVSKYNVPGDAHIGCNNPDPLTKGYRHGIINGWFYYPVLFDPTWMITKCRNFKEKENAIH